MKKIKYNINHYSCRGDPWVIENDTKYKTSDLRKFILRGLTHIAEGPRKYYIHFVSSRGPWTSGYAFLDRVIVRRRLYRDDFGSIIIVPSHIKRFNRNTGTAFTWSWRYICLRLPQISSFTGHMDLPETHIKRAARVLIHEWQHTLGFRHKDMGKCENIVVPWAEGLKLGFEIPPTAEKAAERRDS